MKIKIKINKKILASLLGVFLAFGLICYYYFLPLFLKEKLPSLIHDLYGHEVKISDVEVISPQHYRFQNVSVKVQAIENSYASFDFKLKNLELKVSLVNLVLAKISSEENPLKWINGLKLIELDQPVLESELAIVDFDSNVKVIVKGAENIACKIEGKYQGSFEIKRSEKWISKINLTGPNGFSWKAESEYKKGNLKTLGELKAFAFKDLVLTKSGAPMDYGKIKSLQWNLEGDPEFLQKYTGGNQQSLGKDFIGSLSIELSDLGSNSFKLAETSLQVSIKKKEMDIKFKCNPNQDHVIAAELNISPENNLKGSFNVNFPEIETLFGMVGILPKGYRGNLHLKGEIAEHLMSPNIQVLASSSLSTASDLQFNLRSRISYQNKILSVPEFHVEEDRGRLDMEVSSIDYSGDVLGIKFKKLEAEILGENFSISSPFSIERSKSILILKDFSLQSKETSITVDTNLKDDLTGSASLNIKNISINRLLHFLPMEKKPKLVGRIDARIEFSDKGNDPNIHFALESRDLFLSDRALGVGEIKLHLNNKRIEISKFQMLDAKMKSLLKITGQVPVNFKTLPFQLEVDKLYSGEIHGNLNEPPLAIVPQILPGIVQLDGKLSGDFRCILKNGIPDLSGKLELSDGIIQLAGTLPGIKNAQGEIYLEKEELTIKKPISARMGMGSIEIGGSYRLTNSEFNFDILGRRLKVMNDADLEVVISPELKLSGNLKHPKMTGKVLIDKALYRNSVANLQEKMSDQKPSDETDFLNRTALDIQVISNGSIYLKEKNSTEKMNLRCSANLRIKGFVMSPVILGNLKVHKNSSMVFLGRQFLFEEFEVNLPGEDEPPYLKGTAVFVTRTITVRMSIDQELGKHVQLEWSSVPPLPEEKIKEVLITGSDGSSMDVSTVLNAGGEMLTDLLGFEENKWLRGLKLEAKTLETESGNTVGFAADYSFPHPHWLALRAEQDDQEYLNYMIIFRWKFYGFRRGGGYFQDSEFIYYEPEELEIILKFLKNLKGFTIPLKKEKEFKLQYLLQNLNVLLDSNRLIDYLKNTQSEDEKKLQKLKKNLNKLKKGNQYSGYARRKFNRSLLGNHLKLLSYEFIKMASKRFEESKKPQLPKKFSSKPSIGYKKKRLMWELISEDLLEYEKEKNKQSLLNAQEKIQEVLLSWGYHEARCKFEEYKKGGVRFIADPGPRIKLMGILFEGVDKKEQEELSYDLNVKTHKFYSPVYYFKRKTESFKNKVLVYYHAKGFLDAEVVSKEYFSTQKLKKLENADSEIATKGPYPKYSWVSFSIQKNLIHRVKSISCIGTKFLSSDKVVASVTESILGKEKKLSGSIFYPGILTKLKREVLKYYQNRGYFDAKVEISHIKEESGIGHDIVIKITEGSVYTISGYSLTPKNADRFKTNRIRLQKCIKFNPGNIYELKRVEDSRTALSRLGVFNSIQIIEKRTGQDIHIEFLLEESKSLVLEVFSGYGEKDLFMGGFRAFDKNIFGTGLGLDLRARASFTGYSAETILSQIKFKNFDNYYRAYFKEREEEGFTRIQGGAEAVLLRKFKKYFKWSSGYKLEALDAVDVSDSLRSEVDTEKLLLSGVYSLISYSKFKSPNRPYKGLYLEWRVEGNFKTLGSNIDFVKSEWKATVHTPLFPDTDRFTFSLGGRLGIMKSLNSEDEIPIQARFFNGGGNSVRGFDLNDLGPHSLINGDPFGGEGKIVLNSEIRFPLSFETKSHFGAIFFDAGALEEKADSLDSADWSYVVGLGYRFITPIGPLRIDYGFNLDKEIEEASFLDTHNSHLFINGHRGFLYLSIGYAF